LKLFGKELAKTETQIQGLCVKVAELEEQLAASKADYKKLKESAAKVQTEATKTLVDANSATNKINEVTQENELLLSQLFLVHGELEEIFLDKKQLETSLAEIHSDALKEAEKNYQVSTKLEQEISKLNAELVNAKADLFIEKQKLVEANKVAVSEKIAKHLVEKTFAEFKANSSSESKVISEKFILLTNGAKDLDTKLLILKDQLAQSQSALASAKAEVSKTHQEKLDLETLQADTKSELEQLKKAALLQTDQQTAKLKDAVQENELLLLQLMQVQEQLQSYHSEKIRLEKQLLKNQARWERIEKRLPNYLDFGAIEITDVDGVSDVPSITWHVKDFAQAGVALTDFSFVTVLQDGHPGIGLLKDGKPLAFVPKLLGTDKAQLGTFLGLGTSEFKQLTAAVSILDQLESGQWQGFEFPAQFDPSFWRPSLKTLIAQLKQLPALLRYDEVRLKRELINPDYEHLWLEFQGLSMGAAHWKKFEIRLGAALVQAEGFSQYPKFEIPLIDGKTKPFESWYAESQDDGGAKLELRFSLEKNVFDVAVWVKLADADKALLLRIFYAMPDALKRLQAQKTSIHRSWATWIDFATAAVKVLEANKATAKVAAVPAKEVAQLETKALPAPTKQTETGAKASKVISIGTKPAAKNTTTKTVRKTKA
jgi:hypothetical protein